MKNRLYWLNSVDSTNEELKRRLKSGSQVYDLDAVFAKYQTNGKGQRGNSWESEHASNLTFSMYLQPNNLSTSKAFSLNKVVSVLIVDYLKSLGLKKLSIKWPNDILVGEKKICGILIENSIAQSFVLESIIGIGLNVNQQLFATAAYATSIYNELKEEMTVELVGEDLLVFLNSIHHFLYRPELLNERYHELLFGLHQERSFVKNGCIEKGIIQRVNQNGELMVEFDGELLSFQQKELGFMLD